MLEVQLHESTSTIPIRTPPGSGYSHERTLTHKGTKNYAADKTTKRGRGYINTY